MTFEITDEQMNKINEWDNTHDCSLRKQVQRLNDCACSDRRSLSCIGGETTFQFTPTSIGTIITAVCACGAKLVVQDL